MFGIGETELVIIVLFAFMVFGPDKLPGMGRTIGRALRQFREAQQGFTQVVQTEVLDPAAEAMNVAPTRRTRNRAAELEADSDIEDGAEGTVRRKETFAERRARLEAERKAAAEAAAAAEAEAAPDAEAETAEGDEGTDEVETEVATETAASAPEIEAEAEAEDEDEEASVDNALASLYGISAKSARKQKSEDKAAEVAARKAAAEAAAAEKAAAEAAAAEAETEDDTEPEPEADVAPAADIDDTGKEDGTEA